ncbi:FimV/HubP family polar landmark protein [Microbulbifer sp. SSSA008]|uniref:FimV/HubP family polar landmark protein n=1 Tax=Microbulbifer sp. SSSA008 TaxID=3243380 RepID=UPI004039F961
MRVRKLALAVGLVGALGSNAALALGLGEIKLNSTLNQPLDAEIGLLQTRGLEDTEIRVRLAGPEEFERAGVERSYLLTSLSFEVDYSGGKPVIRISSRDAIREPFLNFLVETRWPSGRLLREYTLLMDLPAFSPTAAQQPVRAAERERQQVRRTAPVQQPQPRTTPAPAARQAPAEPAPTERAAPETREPARPQPRYTTTDTSESNSQVYGPVSSSDTLWEIALQNRASREFSVQQTMLAIQRLNPEAFINDNINLLKKGAVLRLPNTEDLRTLTMTEAISEVAQQNDSWRQRSEVEVATGAPLDARAVEEESYVSETVEGRVSLAAPGDNESVTSGSGVGTDDSEALEGDLTVAEEELDKSKLENTELRERIAELDEQIDTMDTLIDVSNEELAAVQAAAEQSDVLLDPTEADDVEVESLDDSLTIEDSEEFDVAADTEEETVEAEPAPAETRNRVVEVQTKPKPTFMEQLADNGMLIGLGGAGLLAAIFGLFTWRRRKAEQEAQQELEQQMAMEQEPLDIPENIAEPDETLAAVESMEADDTFDLGDLGDVGTDDPISEAEIHLSLGQYEEAESKLLLGLEKDPQVVDARLMLMEVYAHNQDVEKFDDHYRQLLSISDGPAADRAARLRESIAGAPDFEAPAMGLSNESFEAAQLDDIGAALDDDFTSAEPGLVGSGDALEPDTSLLDDLTMDLSLDQESSGSEQELSLDLELDSSIEEPLQASADQGESLDTEFNLDDLDLDSALDGDSQEVTAEVSEPEVENDLNLDELDLGELDLGDLGSSNQEPALIEDDLGLELSDNTEESVDAPIEFDTSELDLDSLDLEPAAEENSEASVEAQLEEKATTSGGSVPGLDFELDLSMMEEEIQPQTEGEASVELDTAFGLDDALELDSVDSGLSEEIPLTEGVSSAQEPAEELSMDDFSEGDLEMIGGDLDSDLDLDGIDLDDIAADLNATEQSSAEVAAASSEPAADLSLDADLDTLDAAGMELAGASDLDFNADAIEEEFSLEDELALIDESTEGDLTLEPEPLVEAKPEAIEQVEAIVEKPSDSDFGDLDFNLESDLNSELSLLEGGDEMATKLELAQAYMDMGDEEGAKDILKEVAQDGGGEHKDRAEEMLERMV